MRKRIREFLNKRGYEIIKQEYLGDIYPNVSSDKSEYYCKTPIGNFHLPITYERDAVANFLIRGKIFEPEIVNLAKRFIKPNTSVLDVGANFGQMSIEFSKLTGLGTVYSFEAQKVVFNLLEKNVKENASGKVKLTEKAVYSEDNKTLYFPAPDMASEAPYSGNHVEINASIGTPVQTITIDSLEIPEAISFMKIDIEGADIFALRGAIKTIEKNRMPIVFEYIQHMQQSFGTTFQDYVEFTESINYKFEEIILGINYLIIPKEMNI